MATLKEAPKPPAPILPPPEEDALRGPAILEHAIGILQDLGNSHDDELTINKLSEPIATTVASSSRDGPDGRTSDVSTSSTAELTPVALEAELEYNKELFKKLRFSYLEQSTKERALRALIASPELGTLPEDILEMETCNEVTKNMLQEMKRENQINIEHLQEIAVLAARSQAQVDATAARLRGVVEALESLREQMAALQDDPVYAVLPSEVQAQIADNKRKASVLDEAEAELEEAVAESSTKVRRLEGELDPLLIQRDEALLMARDAKNRRDEANERLMAQRNGIHMHNAPRVVDPFPLEVDGRSYVSMDVFLTRTIDATYQQWLSNSASLLG